MILEPDRRSALIERLLRRANRTRITGTAKPEYNE